MTLEFKIVLALMILNLVLTGVAIYRQNLTRMLGKANIMASKMNHDILVDKLIKEENGS